MTKHNNIIPFVPKDKVKPTFIYWGGKVIDIKTGETIKINY